MVVALTAGLLCAIGCFDDILDLNPRLKLVLQTASTMPVVLTGYYVERIAVFGHSVELGWFGVLLTTVWIVGCINALNLLDGMDGLASIVGVLSATMIALIAATGQHHHVALIAMALSGALIGFLAYNLPPASIYLGDSGSMVIGLVIGILAFQGSLETSATLSITIPAVVMTIPILDTVLALARRRLSGRPFDVADRGHLHHRLLQHGLTKWQALYVIGTLCLTTGAAAAAATVFRSEILAWITAIGVVLLLVCTRAFGNHEVALVKLAVAHALSRLVRRLVDSRRSRSVVSRSTLCGMTFDRAWDLLVEEVQKWQAQRLELVITRDGQHPDQKRMWVDPTEPSLSCVHWSFEMTFSGPDRHTCQLRVHGRDAGISQQWALVQLMRVLKPFGEHWTVPPEQDHASRFRSERMPVQPTDGHPPSHPHSKAA
jgi:UDP-GlcNAc:undecaprenyl-phosphate GlcNAc-1-phosphate transferase